MKTISEKLKTRAAEWATNPARALTCSICGATGPILTVGDTDVLHRRFSVRCSHHTTVRPQMRNVYSMIYEVTGDAAWFASNPDRTFRVRPPSEDEVSRHPTIGPMVVLKRDGKTISFKAKVGQTHIQDNDVWLGDLYGKLMNQSQGDLK